jgi:tRNA modification GTPase
MEHNQDTIVAQATASGRGGVGIVRVSGPLSASVAHQVLGRIPNVRQAEYLPFKDHTGEILDQGIALYFKSPNSFTGEDVLELQGHGGQIVMDLLIKVIFE